MSSPRPRSRQTRPLQSALAVWLALVLTTVNLLGLAHRVAHAGGSDRQVAAAADEPGRDDRRRLFDAHAELGSCDRFDQLSTGAAPPIAPALLSFAAPAATFDAGSEQSPPALPRRAAQARGPPLDV